MLSSFLVMSVCGIYEENYPFLFNFSNLVEYRFLKYVHVILWIFLVSFVIIPFSSLILLIWIFSLYLLVNLNKGLPILLIFLKNQLYFIDSFIVLLVHFYFTDFSAEFDYFLPSACFGCDFFFLF